MGGEGMKMRINGRIIKGDKQTLRLTLVLLWINHVLITIYIFGCCTGPEYLVLYLSRWLKERPR